MVVTFCGHGNMTDTDGIVRIWLRQTVAQLIDEGADKFYLGGYGSFDGMAASVVWELKQTHPHIQSVLVLPYLDKKVFADHYDYTTYPPLEAVPRKFAIPHRNRWMVEAADVLVAYVLHSWGGAAQTLEHALRKKKRIIQYQNQNLL